MQSRSTELIRVFSQVQERDVEIVQLSEEYKKVIAMHQEQLVASAETATQLALQHEGKQRYELERNTLAAELLVVEQSYSAFKTQERARMTVEV